MFLNARLAKQHRLRGIETDAEPVCNHFERALINALRRRVVGRQRMPIGDEEVTPILLLETKPIRQRAMQMTEMKPPRGSHSANDGFHMAPT